MLSGLNVRIFVKIDDYTTIYEFSSPDEYETLRKRSNEEYGYYHIKVGTILRFKEHNGIRPMSYEVTAIETSMYPEPKEHDSGSRYDVKIDYIVKRYEGFLSEGISH